VGLRGPRILAADPQPVKPGRGRVSDGRTGTYGGGEAVPGHPFRGGDASRRNGRRGTTKRPAPPPARLRFAPVKLDEIRDLVRPDLAALDEAVRARLKSTVPLVDQVAEHIIAGGGKRLRPLLVLLASRACGGQGQGDAQAEPATPASAPTKGKARAAKAGAQPHVEAAAFIEFIHTATLLHDDVVDGSSKRRGRDTANAVYGNQASVLVGDFVYSRAFQMMAALKNQRVMEIMAEATNTIAEGEVLQLMNAHDPQTTEQRYLEVIYRKTARLFAAGAEVAAVLAGSPPAVQKALADYGRHLGTAYQLVDDVLDYRSNPEERGKNLGDDLAEGKPTLPLIHALKHGDPNQKAAIASAIQHGGLAQMEPVLQAIEATGGLDYTLQLSRRESDLAIAALAPLPASAFKQGLEALSRFAVEHTT
jgi:octaprenyl-diphosphate synthase